MKMKKCPHRAKHRSHFGSSQFLDRLATVPYAMSRQPKRQRQGVQAGTEPSEQPETEVEPEALTRFLSGCSFCLTCNRVRPSARQHKSTAMKKEGVMHDLRPMTAAETAQERQNWLQRQALGPGERGRQVQVEHARLTREQKRGRLE
jgi:molybdenum cofactor biosynthesis enzyme MoaA